MHKGRHACKESWAQKVPPPRRPEPEICTTVPGAPEAGDTSEMLIAFKYVQGALSQSAPTPRAIVAKQINEGIIMVTVA